jgi:hypothetical protein
MLLQLPPRAETVLMRNYESRVVQCWLGYVGGGVNGAAPSKCVRVSSL